MSRRLTGLRGTHISTLRLCGRLIFGTDFQQEWFPSKFNGRGDIEMLQRLVTEEKDGKKAYPLFPPILYPEGSARKRDVFLNPALINVSGPLSRVLAFEDTDQAQVLKVILFGRSSLENNGRSSGPTPSGVKWGLTEVTPGAIALAAVIVSPSGRRFLRHINSTCRFERCCHLIWISRQEGMYPESTTWSRSGSTKRCYPEIPQTPPTRGLFRSSMLLSLA